MPRPTALESAAPGQDSFLDIMTNMVGILVLLLMIAGMRIKNTPVHAATGGTLAAINEQLADTQAAEQSLTGDVWRIAREAETIEQHLQRAVRRAWCAGRTGFSRRARASIASRRKRALKSARSWN